MRFVANIAIIRGITVSNEALSQEQDYLNRLFKNDLFQSLTELMRFVVSSKSQLSFKEEDLQSREKSEKSQLVGSDEISLKVIEIKKYLELNFPGE